VTYSGLYPRGRDSHSAPFSGKENDNLHHADRESKVDEDVFMHYTPHAETQRTS